jgi:glycosyl transferase family 1
MATIALLGNHSCAFSTESELVWTLENLGHRVVKLQENEITTDEVVTATRERGSRLFIYVHTHGWGQVGTISREKMIDELRKSGIKTCSFHLDRFWGLNALDQREERIGNDAFWKTDTVFTADGGNDDRFRDRGVNHVWLAPAVVERDCYFGKATPQYNSPLAFTGADGYHPEYPFRGLMVSRLKEKYGSQFRVYQGVRQDNLNNLYASVRVIVGDSCFAGSDRYWSDRVPEVLGRGGFLIFPKTPGLDIPGLVTYEPGNINDLIKKIDYWIDDDRQAERKEIVKVTQAHVKAHDTYTNRMKVVLDVMGVK